MKLQLTKKDIAKLKSSKLCWAIGRLLNIEIDLRPESWTDLDGLTEEQVSLATKLLAQQLSWGMHLPAASEVGDGSAEQICDWGELELRLPAADMSILCGSLSSLVSVLDKTLTPNGDIARSLRAMADRLDSAS